MSTDKEAKQMDDFSKESVDFLYNYLNAFSPSGEEWEGQGIWIDNIRPHVDEVQTDSYGNAYGIIRGGDELSTVKKVVLEAHCDEIAWQITHIQSDGIIRLARNGGSDSIIAPSKRGVVHTRKSGRVNGVFGFPAIHVRKKTTSAEIAPEDILFDVGVDTKADVEALGIEVGNMVTFNDPLMEMGNYYVGRSLDNKIGGFIISEVAKRLKQNNVTLPFDLYITNCITEETGLNGAYIAAGHIKPDCALVVDVCHHTATPTISKSVEGDIISGEGPMIEMKFQNHRKLTELYRSVADENNVKYQLGVGSTGNDTMSFYRHGVPTAILGVPLKYMHTTNESVHQYDIKATIDIFYHTLLELSQNKLKYFNF